MKKSKIHFVGYTFNWLVILVLVSVSCNKLELPAPNKDDQKVFELRGTLMNSEMAFNTEKYKMITDIEIDELGVRVFTTKFESIDENIKAKLTIQLRDNRIYQCCLDTVDVLSPGNYLSFNNDSTSHRTYILQNTIINPDIENVVWSYNGSEFEGPYLTIDKVNPNQAYKICIQKNGVVANSFSSYCKTFVPGLLNQNFDISIDRFETNRNILKAIVSPGIAGNVLFFWNGTSVPSSNEIQVLSNGKYALSIEGKPYHSTHVEFDLNLSNEALIPPTFTSFESSLEELADSPKFSKSIIIYEDGLGNVYSSLNAPDAEIGYVRILESDHIELTNDLGKPMKKVKVQFNASLYDESGDSIKLEDFKGFLGFSIE